MVSESSLSGQPRGSSTIFWSAAISAVALRLLCTRWPGNFDFDSWNIVADITLDGRNVYASTDRYNYGPVWAYILAALKWVSGAHFRIAICLFLSAVDIGIAAFLRKHAGIAAALFFLFAPWSILITGHHGQFDNVAVLIGLLAVGFVSTRPGFAEKGVGGLTLKQTAVAAAILGLSLTVKHVLFLFPVWMAFRVPGIGRRFLWLAIPFGIFAASFLPFWTEGHDGISTNVLRYSSDSDAPFLNVFGPGVVDMLLGCQPHTRIERYFFFGALMLAGALLRRRSLLEVMAFYTAFIVIFSCGIWNHYLVIPTLFTAMFRNAWSVAFQLLALPFYMLHHDAFHYGEGLAAKSSAWKWIWDALEWWGHHFFMALLVFAVVDALWGRHVREAGKLLVRRLGEALQGRA